GCPDYDNDGDGIPDSLDNCPNEVGPRDNDGCPVHDSDGDGIPDSLDQCPDEAEDFDGFEDEDGCPDYDNDGDGIPDSLDQCPEDPEDKDGFEDEDGCPDPDNDEDGIADVDDECPNKAGPADNGGCPVNDADGDGVPDSADKCPQKPGPKDNNGCPVTKAKEIKRGRIVLKGVNFESGKAVLTRGSYETLDKVVESLKDWPEINLRIEGHTDAQGSADYNRELSYKRAKAVLDYFVAQGIKGSRLRAVGKGEADPIANNATASGRAENRRVELHRTDN
ncbi:MAG: OmpA family protein, partial [Fibrobacterota bacterium]